MTSDLVGEFPSAGELRLDQVTAGWGHPVLRDLTLEVPAGQLCAVVGPNGSGKSTLIHTIYGSIRPSAGTILLDAVDLRTLPRAEVARRVAVVGQGSGDGFDFTGAEMVLLGRTPHLGLVGAPSADDHQIAAAAMAQTGSTQFAERPLSQLSGGETQRVLIARALAQQPRLLLLDEPTNHLDPAHQLMLLDQLRRSQLTVLVTLHSLDLAVAFADQLLVLADGRIVAGGPPTQALTPLVLREVFGVTGSYVTDPVTGLPRLLLNSLDIHRHR